MAACIKRGNGHVIIMVQWEQNECMLCVRTVGCSCILHFESVNWLHAFALNHWCAILAPTLQGCSFANAAALLDCWIPCTPGLPCLQCLR